LDCILPGLDILAWRLVYNEEIHYLFRLIAYPSTLFRWA
jgi:hypothetical protein